MHRNMTISVTSENFNEFEYLASNPDVRNAVHQGQIKDGKSHFREFGYIEKRHMRSANTIEDLREKKMSRLLPYLRHDMEYFQEGKKYNYLSDKLRKMAGIAETDSISSHGYDDNILELIKNYPDGLILDCGAGRRDIYYDNVVNFEIVDYDSTDVIGVGEELPFLSNTFDAVVSIAVLEHVKDPFKCALEIIRVLKPGGKLYCSVPFLQPYHGYPHHYFNMTHQGLKSLFDHTLQVTDQQVLESTGPVWTLTWFLQRWSAELPEKARKQFLALRVSDLVGSPQKLLSQEWVKQLPKAAQFELASATVLFATK
jgi:SAM-dependent methyltransferase